MSWPSSRVNALGISAPISSKMSAEGELGVPKFLLLPGRGKGMHLLAVYVTQRINKQIINKQMWILALTTWQLTAAHSAWHGKEEIIYI